MRSTLLAVALICLSCSCCQAAEGKAAPKIPPSDAKAAAPAGKAVDRSVDMPPLAVSPFDAARAKRHQEAWAKYLGVPVQVTNSIGMQLVLIPPGEFRMGSPVSEPARDRSEYQHRVRITKAFCLGVYEVTCSEYARVVGMNPSFSSPDGRDKYKVLGLDAGRFPVENVSWDDAAVFCRKLSALPGERTARRVYRVPTEAEWEYACRAGTTTPFHFGSQLDGREANCNGNYPYGTESKGPDLERPTTVGSYPPNAFGLYDMHGNVWEWCEDSYDENYYKASPVDDPQGPAQASMRVYRGGSWGLAAKYCRSANRYGLGASGRRSDLGFRVALVVPASQASRQAKPGAKAEGSPSPR